MPCGRFVSEGCCLATILPLGIPGLLDPPEDVLDEDESENEDYEDVQQGRRTNIHRRSRRPLVEAASEEEETETEEKVTPVVVLMELVGAVGLDFKNTVDPICYVSLFHDRKWKVVHWTDIVWNDSNPIWTAKTKSLCLLELLPKPRPQQEQQQPSPINQEQEVDVRNNTTGEERDDVSSAAAGRQQNQQQRPQQLHPQGIRNGHQMQQSNHDHHQDDVVRIDIHSRNSYRQLNLGRVEIPYSDIWEQCENNNNSSLQQQQGHHNRVEYRIQQRADMVAENADLAVRFRYATANDQQFVKIQNRNSSSRAVLDFLQLHSSSSNSSSLFYSPSSSSTSVRDMTQPRTSISYRSLFDENEDRRRVAADINFQVVRHKQMFQTFHKKVKQQNSGPRLDLYRIVPYPDPSRPKEETEWMSAAQIEQTAMEPSQKWVTAGSGQVGRLHVEILGCDNLPNLDYDIGNNDLTDAFVVLAFEDNLLRTDVIWDHLNPRWMPWTTRAFQFAIQHPASLLFLSVLDYDEGPMNTHDAVGRIVLRLSNYRPNVTYTLHYPLQDDPTLVERTAAATAEQHTASTQRPRDGDGAEETEDNVLACPTSTTRGNLILRLRLEWENESLALKMYRAPPPRFILNVDNKKSYQALLYTTRGAVFMNEASLASVKLLANELMSYGSSICFVMDVLLEMFLWRGRLKVSENRSIWFPMRSMVLLTGVVALIEHPDQVLPISLYGIAWILLSVNYHESSHPNPWKRVASSRETNMMMFFGRRSFSPVRDSENIVPNQGLEAQAIRDKLDQLKTKRMSALLRAVLSFASKYSSMRSKTKDTAVKITSSVRKNRWSFLSGQLYYIHLLLSMMVTYLRLGRSFLGWKTMYTAVFTTNCIMLATAWLVFPMSWILKWVLRILAWTLLGPLMKIVDIKYFRPWYETKEELLGRIRAKKTDEEPVLPDFDRWLASSACEKLSLQGRIKAEELYKLKDMRTLLFGEYSEAIPCGDDSRYPSVPLPRSTAVHSDWISQYVVDRTAYHVPGQRLEGNMVHGRHTLPVALATERHDPEPPSDDKKTN